MMFMLSILFLAGESMAKIPEPDNIIYGPVTANGLPVTTGNVTITLNGSSSPIAQYSIGSDLNVLNSYILRIPIDSNDPKDPDTARPGDLASIYLDGNLAATAVIGARGTVTKISLSTCLQMSVFYKDKDADSYGDPLNSIQSCSQSPGYVTNNTDCNDNDASIHPGATETCNGKDDNCSGLTDEGGDIAFYRDADNDTYGNPLVSELACSPSAGYVTNNTDCNDSDSKEYPGQTWYKDADRDGYSDGTNNTTSCPRPAGYKVVSELKAMTIDCNDSNASIYPGALELCDEKDNDCNGQIDDSCVLQAGKMSRTSHFIESNGWIVRAYSRLTDSGFYSIYLEMIDTNSDIVPYDRIEGFIDNPVLLAENASVPDVTLTFDKDMRTAYIVYTTSTGQKITKMTVNLNP